MKILEKNKAIIIQSLLIILVILSWGFYKIIETFIHNSLGFTTLAIYSIKTSIFLCIPLLVCSVYLILRNNSNQKIRRIDIAFGLAGLLPLFLIWICLVYNIN